MNTSKELIETVENYYHIWHAAYSNWGPDPNRNGIFAIHFGYHTSDRVVDNHTAVLQMTQKVVEVSKIASGQKVLDAGCGTGSVAFAIASDFPTVEVHAINIVANQLAIARDFQKKHHVDNIYLYRQDFLETAFRSCLFDRIIFCESLAHAEDKLELLKEAKRLLRKNGEIIIADVFTFTDVEDFNDEEKLYLRHCKIGMGVSGVVSFSQFINWLEESGFSAINPVNITQNILPSVVLASDHASQRIREDLAATKDITEGRQAIIGIERLLSSNKAGYFLLTARL